MWYGIHENTAGAGLLMIAPFSCFSKLGYLFFHHWFPYQPSMTSMISPSILITPRIGDVEGGPVIRGGWCIPKEKKTRMRDQQPPRSLWYQHINGHFRNLNWRYLPYLRPIFQAYVREYPHKIWAYMVQYLHFRILKFPLKILQPQKDRNVTSC